MILINNCFVISFLSILIINILNFETHQCNSLPQLFNYNCEVDVFFLNLKISNGSFYFCKLHIHHWLMGLFFLVILLLFFENSCLKSVIQGIAAATILDGLLFSDRFKFTP